MLRRLCPQGLCPCRRKQFRPARPAVWQLCRGWRFRPAYRQCCCPYCREQLRPAGPEDLCLYCRRSLHARCPKQQLLKQMLKPRELQEYHMQRHRILPEHHQRNDSHVPDPEKDCHRRRDCHRKQFPRGLLIQFLRALLQIPKDLLPLLLRGLLQMKCRCRLLS